MEEYNKSCRANNHTSLLSHAQSQSQKKNLSWYLRENHSCLQLKGYHVTSTVTKLNDIDGLSIITIYVFKLIFMVLIPKMGSCFLEYIDGFFPKWEIVKNHSVIKKNTHVFL